MVAQLRHISFGAPGYSKPEHAAAFARKASSIASVPEGEAALDAQASFGGFGALLGDAGGGGGAGEGGAPWLEDIPHAAGGGDDEAEQRKIPAQRSSFKFRVSPDGDVRVAEDEAADVVMPLRAMDAAPPLAQATGGSKRNSAAGGADNQASTPLAGALVLKSSLRVSDSSGPQQAAATAGQVRMQCAALLHPCGAP